MVKYAEQHDTHPTTALLSRHISLPSKCLSILKACYTICVYAFLCFVGLCAVNVWTENNIFVCREWNRWGYLLPRHPIREQCVPKAIEYSHIWTLYDTCALVFPCATAVKCPLIESRHWPNMPPPHVSTKTQPQRDTQADRNWRHTPTLTHLRANKRERENAVLGETDTKELIREWESVVWLWLTSGCKRICGYLDGWKPGAVDSPHPAPPASPPAW